MQTLGKPQKTGNVTAELPNQDIVWDPHIEADALCHSQRAISTVVCCSLLAISGQFITQPKH